MTFFASEFALLQRSLPKYLAVSFTPLLFLIGSNRIELAVVLEPGRGDLLHAKANQSGDSQADLSNQELVVYRLSYPQYEFETLKPQSKQNLIQQEQRTRRRYSRRSHHE